MNHPRILGIGRANPPVGLTRTRLSWGGHEAERIRKIFPNIDLEHRHFYLEGPLNRKGTSDQMNQRHLRGKNRLPRNSELCGDCWNYCAGCRFVCCLHV
jgi:hypothetical protein